MDKNEQDESLPPTSKVRPDPSDAALQLDPSRQWIGTACAIIASVILGYFLGLYQTRETSTSRYGLPSKQSWLDLGWEVDAKVGISVPSGPVHITWQHNLTFTQSPSPESEAAWNSIIPVGRGFVHHDQLAPFVSNIAVFHQLHCMVSLSYRSRCSSQSLTLCKQHAIVVAYYKALESPPSTNLTDVPDFDNHTSTRIAPFHIRHCFDYIRQALMCAADTNLEMLDRETRLTNGWGQPKQCRDYAHISAWAERYADSSDTGIVT